MNPASSDPAQSEEVRSDLLRQVLFLHDLRDGSFGELPRSAKDAINRYLDSDRHLDSEGQNITVQPEAFPGSVTGDKTLDERMKAAGMIPLSDILAGRTPMERWTAHAGVTDIPSFEAWLTRRHAEFLRMQVGYDLGDKPKDDELYEWVLAHAASFGEVAANLRKALACRPSATGTAPDKPIDASLDAAQGVRSEPEKPGRRQTNMGEPQRDKIATALPSGHGFGFDAGPMEGGQDAYDIGMETPREADAIIRVLPAPTPSDPAPAAETQPDLAAMVAALKSELAEIVEDRDMKAIVLRGVQATRDRLAEALEELLSAAVSVNRIGAKTSAQWGRLDAGIMRARSTLGAPAESYPAARPDALADGWLYHCPDTGTEWSPNHPVESGEVADAEDVRAATATALREELLSAWEALADAEKRAKRQPDVLAGSAAADGVLREDTERLNWMIAHGAHVAHGKDGELCSVWLGTDWDGEPVRPADEEDERAVPRRYPDARQAIDAARSRRIDDKAGKENTR